jgi:hypothetical protein
MVLLFMALCTWSLTRSALQGRPASAAAAGAWYFLGSLISVGFNIYPVFGGLWVAAMAWRATAGPGRGLLRTAWVFGLAAAVALGLHALLYLASGRHFNYLAVMSQSQHYHHNINLFRVYGLWSWANVLLYMGYAGLGLMAAFAARSFSTLWKMDRSDAFTLLASAFVWLLIFSAMGRAEVERIFIFGGMFLAVPAARWCAVPAAGPALPVQGFSIGRLLSLCALNVACMACLQVFVLDFW